MKQIYWQRLWLITMVCLLLGACRSHDCIGDIPDESSAGNSSNATPNPGSTDPNTPANLEKIPPRVKTPAEKIVDAVEEGDLTTVETMLAEDPELINATHSDTGASLLMVAIEFNKLVLAQYLVEQGIDTSIVDNEGNDAQHYASELGNPILVDIINGDLTGDNLDEAFLTEVEKSNLESLAFLLELGANINASDPNSAGRTALIIAIGKGDLDLLKFLLENGINTTIVARGREMKASDYAARTRAPPEVVELLKTYETENP